MSDSTGRQLESTGASYVCAQTWFEVKVDHDLAILLQRIVNIYNRIGKARRAQLLARISSALHG